MNLKTALSPYEGVKKGRARSRFRRGWDETRVVGGRQRCEISRLKRRCGVSLRKYRCHRRCRESEAELVVRRRDIESRWIEVISIRWKRRGRNEDSFRAIKLFRPSPPRSGTSPRYLIPHRLEKCVGRHIVSLFIVPPDAILICAAWLCDRHTVHVAKQRTAHRKCPSGLGHDSLMPPALQGDVARSINLRGFGVQGYLSKSVWIKRTSKSS